MRVAVKLFAILRDKAGTASIPLELAEGATVVEAVGMLAGLYEGVKPFLARSAYAVNREYVPAATALKDGDELAIIPPVSGG